MKDYAVDRRGDVGSWVREQAMIGLTSLVTLVLEPELIEAHANSRKALKIDEEGGEFLARFVAVLL